MKVSAFYCTNYVLVQCICNKVQYRYEYKYSKVIYWYTFVAVSPSSVEEIVDISDVRITTVVEGFIGVRCDLEVRSGDNISVSTRYEG